MAQKRCYLICPVRGHNASETEEVVKILEKEGWEVHWPPRDVNQDDNATGGYRICSEHRKAMIECDKVFLIWDGESKGCLFDAGMAWALGKPLSVLECPPESLGKAFQNVFYRWESLGPDYPNG